MPQYTILNTAATPTIILSDGVDTFRVQVRGDELYYDETITGLGFDGVEDTDWANIDSAALPGSNEEIFRIGARSTEWMVDQAITATAFGVGAIEDTDWSNIEAHSLP